MLTNDSKNKAGDNQKNQLTINSGEISLSVAVRKLNMTAIWLPDVWDPLHPSCCSTELLIRPMLKNPRFRMYDFDVFHINNKVGRVYFVTTLKRLRLTYSSIGWWGNYDEIWGDLYFLLELQLSVRLTVNQNIDLTNNGRIIGSIYQNTRTPVKSTRNWS